MSIPGIGIVDSTDVALALVLAAALVFFAFSLYPHPHRRRLVSATALALVALFGFTAENLPPLKLPLQAVVIADCAVVENVQFVGQLKIMQKNAPMLRDIQVFVLSSPDGTQCSNTLPLDLDLSVESAPPVWNRDQAIDAAKAYLDSDRKRTLFNWPREWAEHPRIAIAHAPGSALSSHEPLGTPTQTVKLSDGRVAQLYEFTYGRTAVHHSVLTISPPLLTQEPSTRGLTLEIEDERLADAIDAQIDITLRHIVPAPSGDVTSMVATSHLNQCIAEPIYVPKSRIDLKSLEPARVQRQNQSSDLAVLSAGSTDQMARLVLYRRINMPQSKCVHASVWVAVRVDVDIGLSNGGKLRVNHTEMLPVVRTGGVTIVTPGINATAKEVHTAAPGWDLDSMSDGYGVNGGPDINTILGLFFDGLDPEMCNPGCTLLPDSMLEESEKCWFKGAEDVSRRWDKFGRCLKRTRRLAMIGPSLRDIAAVDVVAVEELVNTGKLDVLISSPNYSHSESLASWAPGAQSQPALQSEPRVHLVLSFRDSLRIKGTSSSALAQQQGLINAISSLGLIGPSTEDPNVRNSSTPFQCKPGERFPNTGSLAWFVDLSTGIPKQAPEISIFPSSGVSAGSLRPSGSPQPTRRLKGILKVESPRTSPPSDEQRRWSGAYAQNIICNSPSVRLVGMINELKYRGLVDEKRAYVPRTVIALMAEYSDHVSLDDAMSYEEENALTCLGFRLTEEAEAKVQEYFTVGGSVIIVPINDANNIDPDENVIRAALRGKRLQTFKEIAENISDMSDVSANVHVLSETLASDGSNAENVASELLSVMHNVWAENKRRLLFVGGMLGDGFLTDRRDLCVTRLSQEERSNEVLWRQHGCAFEEGEGWASALNRRLVTPERFVLLDTTDDPFVSGVFRTCAGSEVARSEPHGLGRAVAIGASLFARDMLSQDISYSPNSTTVHPGGEALVRGQCYQQNMGRGVRSPTYTAHTLRKEQSLPVKGHGGLTLLRRFADFAKWDQSSETPRIVAVKVDSESGALTVAATGDEGKDWIWDPAGITNDAEDTVQVRFVSFDYRTGVAKFEVGSEKSYRGALELTLYKWRSAEGEFEEAEPTIVPVDFKGSTPVSPIATYQVEFYQTEPLDLDGQALAIIGMLVATLVLFSPLARRWSIANKFFAWFLARGPRDLFERTPLGAPLFSLDASLTEWGLHPGRSARTRSFGLPAGVRRWQTGDRGGSIRIATLLPMVVPISNVPPLMPEVRLRTVFEAADVLVLIEGSGALASPRSRRAPSKIDFAARLGAFITHAVRLSHGSVELRRVGSEALEYSEPSDTEIGIYACLKEPPNYKPPHSELATASSNGRVVFYLCDGLSANAAHLMRLAEHLAAESGQLRVAAIVSEDDANAIGLRRDPLDGSFDDDSETQPAELLSRRNERLEAIAVLIGRHNASLVTFDTLLDTQAFLERVNDTKLLA